jgi:hypothetical protein
MAFLAGFVAYFAVLWFLWDTMVVYPLQVFVVLLHEISHGVAAVATGGSIQKILLTPDQGGACLCPGGNAFVTLSAGYLGSLAWGVVMLLIATGRTFWHRIALGAIGAIVVGMSLLYVRSAFGFVFGLGFGVALVAGAKYLGPVVQRAALTALGLTSCLYAILDIKSDIIDRPGLESDARMLAELTHVPTLVWGGVWITIALIVSGLLFRRIYKRV